MKFNYSVVEDNNTFKVIENTTGLTIKTYKIKEDARKLMKSLNIGAGFDSWTPAFILKSTTASNPPKS